MSNLPILTTFKAVVLENEPSGKLDLNFDSPTSTFALRELSVPALQDGQVIVKALYFSNDPGSRMWMQKGVDEARVYQKPTRKGDSVLAFGIGRVVRSTSTEVQVDQLVMARLDWQEYTTLDAKALTIIEPPSGISPTAYLGILGFSGITAWAGLTQVCNLEKGQSIVISGAAGAVGFVAVQLAKHVIGASKVIAIAGSDEKCQWLREIGADVAVNYKVPTFKDDLYAATEGYVDTFFDNIGGQILDLMLPRIKKHGVIAVCGSTSTYGTQSVGYPVNWFEVPSSSLRLQGFSIAGYTPQKLGEATAVLEKALVEGKIQNVETVIDVSSLSEVPKIWNGLFEGSNTGKLITHLKL